MWLNWSMLLKKIVIADDNDAIAHMVSMALGDAGYLCLRARDGVEALRLVKAHDPDLLVLDVEMPNMDGHEVARRLKSDVMWSRTPILMLTALSTADHHVKGIDAGADAYMTKPVKLREFAAQVKALIRTARRERDRNPTTDLPGARAVEEQLQTRAAAGAAAVHVDVMGIDTYADQVGYANSEAAIRDMAQLVLDAARDACDNAFVGHIGGADFIVALQQSEVSALVAAIEDRFRRERDALFGDAGHTLALAIASAPAEVAGDALAQRLAQAMRSAKHQGGGAIGWHAALT